jgi:DNA polymerase I-like protein with 3'-5' exonuclease and polymerase domains
MKTINFGIIYFITPQALSEQTYVKTEETKIWIAKHKKLYPQFHRWAQEIKSLTEARGWARLPKSGRQRFCDESNARGEKESPGIMGANFAINGWL